MYIKQAVINFVVNHCCNTVSTVCNVASTQPLFSSTHWALFETLDCDVAHIEYRNDYDKQGKLLTCWSCAKRKLSSFSRTKSGGSPVNFKSLYATVNIIIFQSTTSYVSHLGPEFIFLVGPIFFWGLNICLLPLGLFLRQMNNIFEKSSSILKCGQIKTFYFFRTYHIPNFEIS